MVQFADLEVPLKLRWRQGRDMGIGMNFYPHAVVLRGRVYVGGGNSIQNTVVAVYDPQRNTWSHLPQHNYAFFAMAIVNEKLMLLGGRDQLKWKTTTIIVVWEEFEEIGGRWRYYSEASLPIARDAATAVALDDKWLIVAGGRDDTNKSLSVVDILDLHNHQWYSGAPLPQPAHKMTAAVIGNTLVLLGGISSDWSSQVFSTLLDQLISSATSRDCLSATSLWQTLPDTPLTGSTAIALKGALVSISGSAHPYHYGSNLTAPIYVYKFDPRSRSWNWIEAGHLPCMQLRCACTVLPTL